MKSRKSPKKYEYNGESHTLTEWCTKYNVPRTSIYHRVHSGWSLESALTTPVKLINRYTCNDKTATLKEWSIITGVNAKVMRSYLNKGWSMSRVVSDLTCPITININGKVINTTLAKVSKYLINTPMKLREQFNELIEGEQND